MNPLISVIIPAHNSEETIRLAIDSIRNQTYENIEIIVADDNSNDNTRKIVNEVASIDSRVKLVTVPDDPNRFDKKLNRNTNAGWSARNVGFKFSKGELITFQDADDASLLNRIEIQYNLLKEYDAIHITLDWFQFNENYLSKKFDAERYVNENEQIKIGPDELFEISQKSKGFVAKTSKKLNSFIPFHWKRKKYINKLFFGSLKSYPGAGNSPLFKREVIERVKFRPLNERVWHSFMGRGADRDFNFQIAETFRNSHVFFIPLYMWRQKDQNERYRIGIEEYIIN